MFVVSAVNICTQCLQTASASGGLPSLRLPTEAYLPLDHTGDHPRPLSYRPQMSIWGYSLPPLQIVINVKFKRVKRSRVGQVNLIQII